MMMMKMKMNKHFLFYAVSYILQQVVQCNQAQILYILWMSVYDTFTRMLFAALIWWNGAGTFLHVYFPTVAGYRQGSDLTKSWFATLVWWNRAGTFFPACCILQLLQGTIKVLTLQKQVCILCGVQSFWSLQFAAMWMDIFVQFFVLSPSPMYSYVGRFLAGIAAQFLSHKLVLVIILDNRSTSSI